MNKYFEMLLDTLYELTLLEREGIELSEEQAEEYIKIYYILVDNGIEIPFGVDI